MSLRAVWMLSLSEEEFGNVVFHRCFPTIEKKCKTAYENSYVPLPSASMFASNLLVKLGLPDSKQFVEWRDKANGIMQLPVVELKLNTEELWPIVTITQSSYLICCLPFVENYKNVERDDLLLISSVSIGFSVLLGLLNVLETAVNTDQRQIRLIEIDNFLSLTMPFGTPSDVELNHVSSMLKTQGQKCLKKQPVWKNVEHRGKPLIHIKITEFVRCVMSSLIEGSCYLETFGQVSVKADLENDISLSVDKLPYDSLVVHPLVTLPHGSSFTGATLQKRFRFSPPSHEFVLFHYRSSIPKEPPIEGSFKMLGEDKIELLVQLKLNEKMKNSFDFCDLIIVFFNRGPVKNMEINSNHGSVKLSDDKYTLKWTLGSKFPKDLEAKLTAKLDFLDGPILPNSDPFCIDKNCFVQINFKQSNVTLSGCNIDSKSISVSEGNKPKSIIERSVQSTEYRIWNNYGELPFPNKVISKFQKMFPLNTEIEISKNVL